MIHIAHCTRYTAHYTAQDRETSGEDGLGKKRREGEEERNGGEERKKSVSKSARR